MMKQLPNFWDERQMAACVYCGGNTGTRDHVPSKILLDEPYPENLPIVPACRSCNESFSIDKEYLACLVECARLGSVGEDAVQREKIKRILQMKPALASKLSQVRRMTSSHISFDIEAERVKNVILKLARGHAAFELNEPQYSEPSSVSFIPLSSMPGDVRRNFETPPLPSISPEAGSRAMQRLFILSGTVMTDWIFVQPDRYRYLALAGDGVAIRMIIGEYLGCEVVWA